MTTLLNQDQACDCKIIIYLKDYRDPRYYHQPPFATEKPHSSYQDHPHYHHHHHHHHHDHA